MRQVISLTMIFALLTSALPCGPGYISPLFDTRSAPEVPYTDFAAGRLGIIKPEFRRTVLFAAYRYIAGNGLATPEQQALVEIWKADIDNKAFDDNSVDEAVKAWVSRRKEVVTNEETPPAIYVERSYGGYDFFPNCTKNAFETAAETLADRAGSHGPSDQNVQNWVVAQDQVFANCSSGKTTPEPAPTGAPNWLQKDRAYQRAAASFYALDFADAKHRFAEIAQDSDSPWQETADYLVAHTLIRQASLMKDESKSAPLYDEAEDHLRKFVSRTGKFAASAERLTGLIKYRRRPRERVSELAKQLSFYGGGENFRQDVIDYNWLLDKFEGEILSAEEARKEAAKATHVNEAPASPGVAEPPQPQSSAPTQPSRKNDDDLSIYLSGEEFKDKYFVFYLRRDATDAEAIAEAEKVAGQPLSDVMKERIREQRRSEYAASFGQNQQAGYQGYYGSESLAPSLMPDFLRQDPLTDWLFTYQTKGAEAYLYSLNQFRETGSELWLMTAISKADKASVQLPTLLDAALTMNRRSAAYPTVAYHTARLLLEQGKNAEAKKLIDEMMNSGDLLPISARNSFAALRLKLAETLEDFLKYSLKQPYAFDFDGQAASVDEIIAEQKAFYNPEYDKDGREAYDADVERRYSVEREWQYRLMFDIDAIEVFNQHFPTASLIDVMRSPALPEYMRERFALAIWTRSFVLNDSATLTKVTPDLAKYRPEFGDLLAKVSAAKTPEARDRALLYFVLKNPVLSPYVEDGLGKTDNESGQFESNDWWCEPYDMEYSDESNSEVPRRLPPRPAFLTSAQSQAAQAERKRLKTSGDAPKYLGEKVIEWAKRFPADRRVPEALYIMIEANGWTKYGCGNNEELRSQMIKVLKKNYSNSEWNAKLAAQEGEN